MAQSARTSVEAVEGYSILGNGSNNITLGITYEDVLAPFISRDIDSIVSTLTNRKVTEAGTVIFYVEKINQLRDYKVTDRSASDKSRSVLITVTLDDSEEYNVEYETLDLKRLGVKIGNSQTTVANALMAGWNRGKAVTTAGFMTALCVGGIVQAGEASILAGSPFRNPPITLTWDESKADASISYQTYAQKSIWFPIVNHMASLKPRVTDEYIGLDPKDFIFLCSSVMKNYLLMATSTLGSEDTARSLKDGMVTNIGGLMIKEVPFLGQVYTAGTAKGLSQNITFDFSGVHGVLLHQESIAFTYDLGVASIVRDPNTLNLRNIHKFNYKNTPVVPVTEQSSDAQKLQENMTYATVLRGGLVTNFNLDIIPIPEEEETMSGSSSINTLSIPDLSEANPVDLQNALNVSLKREADKVSELARETKEAEAKVQAKAKVKADAQAKAKAEADKLNKEQKAE